MGDIQVNITGQNEFKEFICIGCHWSSVYRYVRCTMRFCGGLLSTEVYAAATALSLFCSCDLVIVISIDLQ
jgi:hypothetical protein